ncbi:MAG: PPC domain-containing protein [Planctomycetota bacterium]
MRSVIFTLLATFTAACWSAQYYVERVEPRGGQRGTTVDVTFHGTLLNDPKEVLFYNPGIEAIEIQPFVETSKEMKGKITATGTVKAKFRIKPDCALGEHPLRLITAKSSTDTVTFWVGPFPTVDEKEKKLGDNDTPETAQPVALNSTVHGMILSGDVLDKDCYSVEMKKGQRLSVEVEATRLGTLHRGGEFDLCARILTKAGKEIAKNDDNALLVHDPLISMLIPEDGTYIVEVGQQMFYGPTSAYYRLHIGTFVRPMLVYPLGGQVGEKLNVKLFGDAITEPNQMIELPKQPGDFAYFAGKENETPPSANTLRVSTFPNVMEVEPNDTQDKATAPASVPVAFNGIIEKPGDVDYFGIHAEKGANLRIRVFAQGFGSPLDAKIWIRQIKATGNEFEKDDSTLAERDHLQGNGRWRSADMLDPSTTWIPRVTGDYVIGIDDTRGQGGPTYAYRIEIEPVHEKVVSQLAPTNSYPYQYFFRMDLPQGNRFVRNVTLAAAQGTVMKGEYELEAVGLPQGVSISSARFSKDQLTLPVLFTIDPSVKPQSGWMELLARPVDKAVKIDSGSTQGMTFVDRRGGYAWHHVFLDKLAFAVTEQAPYSIEVTQPTVSLVQNGELALEIHVKRNGDFKGVIDVQTDWLPNGVTRESGVTIPATSDVAKLSLQANSKAPAGTYKIVVVATTLEGDRESGTGNTRVASSFIELRVSEPYLTVQIPRSSVERGHHGKIVCELKQNKEFQGEAVCTLKRLPHGVTIIEPLPKITSKDKTVTFNIDAAPEALVGLYKEIFCEITLTENGQSIRQQSGSGILRIDPTRGVKAAKVD